jgi:signal peptidase II
MKKKMLLLVLGCVILDQVIKYIITSNINLNTSHVIINNFFSLTYVHNIGAAWSILAGNRFLLIAIGIITLGVLYYFFVKNKKISLFEMLTYGILAGGILGNLVDRIVWGYVRDYLHFTPFGYQFPIFNLADIFIFTSIVTITIKSLWEDYRCKHIK